MTPPGCLSAEPGVDWPLWSEYGVQLVLVFRLRAVPLLYITVLTTFQQFQFTQSCGINYSIGKVKILNIKQMNIQILIEGQTAVGLFGAAI